MFYAMWKDDISEEDYFIVWPAEQSYLYYNADGVQIDASDIRILGIVRGYGRDG